MNWKTVVILSLSIFLVGTSFAQTKKKHKKITITGYVTDVNEKPLQGISIISDGASSNVRTNKKGFYKIKIKPDTKTLMAFAVNHGGVEVEYDGHTKINFVLLEGLTYSDDNHHDGSQIYDYGYSKIRKMDRSTNTKLIDEKDMDFNSYEDIYDMISHKAGVRRLGDNTLYIVDGQAILKANVANISPVVVESITILNGPEAAIYGSRGADGVVVITLK